MHRVKLLSLKFFYRLEYSEYLLSVMREGFFMKKLYAAGFLFVLIFGCALHFTYELSGSNAVVGIFSARDESTLQHLKLLFWPFTFFSVFEYFFMRHRKNFLFIKALSVLFGAAVIVIVFYTYTAILGKNFLAADIFTFMLGDGAAFYLSYALQK